MNMRVLTILLSVALSAACRPDPGTANYADQEAFADASGTEDGAFFEGPDPFQKGQKRLSIGIFYESGKSDEIAVNNIDTHYYIFDETFQQKPDSERVEGLTADRILPAGQAWWGGGVHWDEPKDLSAWTAMHLSARSSDISLASFRVGMSGIGDSAFETAASAYGFLSDGQWHHLTIPLSDFVAAGLDLSAVQGPLTLLGGPSTAGDSLRIDNVYYSAPGS